MSMHYWKIVITLKNKKSSTSVSFLKCSQQNHSIKFISPRKLTQLPACSSNLVVELHHLERIQRLATRLQTGMRHPPLRREIAAAGLPFLAAATTSGRPDNRLQDIHWSFGCSSRLVFSTFHRTRPRRAPLQGTPKWEPLSNERANVFGGGCEILE